MYIIMCVLRSQRVIKELAGTFQYLEILDHLDLGFPEVCYSHTAPKPVCTSRRPTIFCISLEPIGTSLIPLEPLGNRLDPPWNPRKLLDFVIFV